MGRKRATRSPKLLVIALVVAVLAGGGWYLLHRPVQRALPGPTANTPKPASAVPLAVAIDRVNPANEGREINVDGVLQVTSSARDTELGIGTANALALLRQVEMRQWRETCTAAACAYALAWTEKPIDWRAFRTRNGHDNSTPFPFSSQHFIAADTRLGAFNVDRSLAVTIVATAATAVYPVHIAQLPPNLAATLREEGGVLYTGVAGAPPAPGDLRISFRIVPAGAVRLSAIQKGDRLVALPSR